MRETHQENCKTEIVRMKKKFTKKASMVSPSTMPRLAAVSDPFTRSPSK